MNQATMDDALHATPDAGITVRHQGLAISVQADRETLGWLCEFLGPAFPLAPAVRPDARVRFMAGSEVDFDGPAGERVAFTLDSRAVRLPERHIDGGIRLFDRAARVAFDVSEDGRMTMVRHDGIDMTARIHLMRVVREYAHNAALAAGGLMLHAAAVLLPGGKALAITGAKGSGKTTWLVRLLIDGEVGYLSNDRVLVDPSNGEAVGIPTVISLRAGTRALFPAFMAQLARTGRLVPGPDGTDGSWLTTAVHLCRAAGRPWMARGALSAILIPEPTRGPRPVLRRLDRASAEAALFDAVIGRRSGCFTSDVFITTGCRAPGSALIRERAAALAARIPVFSCSLPDAGNDGAAAALVDECLSALA